MSREQMIQIVDQDDGLIGLMPRDEIDYEHSIYRISALWLTNSNGDILLAQRSPDKDKDPGKWGPAVAGTLEDGETYESNIYKEAEEEIGLTGHEFTKGQKQRIYFPRNYFCQWFKVEVDKDIEEFTREEEEVAALKWIGQEELVEDVGLNPQEYIPIFPDILKLLIGVKS